MDYVRTKAASTASGIVCNVKPFMLNGIPSLARVKSIWSGLQTNNKEGLNQSLGRSLGKVIHGMKNITSIRGHIWTRVKTILLILPLGH